MYNSSTYTNPIIFEDYPDPDIIRVNKDFYMVSSTFSSMPGVPICHSYDLVNWKIIGYAYDGLYMDSAYNMENGETKYGKGSWAPSIRYNNGVFYICFNIPNEGFAVCRSKQPNGKYDMNIIKENMHDPGLFFNDDDKVYVVHGCNNLFATELSQDLKYIKKNKKQIYQSQYGGPYEGSHVYKRNDYYYICNTSKGYNGIQICLRSKNIYGPYESKLILKDDMNYGGAGLHQGGFVELENKETWFFMFQDRDYVGRVPVLQPVTWVSDWPMIGDPNNNWKAVVTYKKPSIVVKRNFETVEKSDEFVDSKLGLQWQWNHNPDNTKWSLWQRPGYLRFRGSYAKDILHAKNTLTQKIVGNGCTCLTSMYTENMGNGDTAGLCILGLPYAYIGILKENNVKKIIMVNNGNIVESNNNFFNNSVYFEAKINKHGYVEFYYSKDNFTYYKIGNKLELEFTCNTFQGNKFGIFNYNRIDESCGYVDFDWFHFVSNTNSNCLDGLSKIDGSNYDSEFGIHIERFEKKKPHQYLNHIHNGDWIKFNYINFGQKVQRFECRTSGAIFGGNIEIRLDNQYGYLLGNCEISCCNQDKEWVENSCIIEPIKGAHCITLVFTSEKHEELFEFHWLRFIR